MVGHTAESFRESLGVTIGATRADLRAARNRVPRGISPFNGGVVAHAGILTWLF